MLTLYLQTSQKEEAGLSRKQQCAHSDIRSCKTWTLGTLLLWFLDLVGIFAGLWSVISWSPQVCLRSSREATVNPWSMLKVHLVGSNHRMRVQMTSLESPKRNSVQMGAWKCHTLCFDRCTIYITHLSRHTHHLHTACFQEIPVMSFGCACRDWIPPNAPCFCCMGLLQICTTVPFKVWIQKSV